MEVTLGGGMLNKICIYLKKSDIPVFHRRSFIQVK